MAGRCPGAVEAVGWAIELSGTADRRARCLEPHWRLRPRIAKAGRRQAFHSRSRHSPGKESVKQTAIPREGLIEEIATLPLIEIRAALRIVPAGEVDLVGV